MGAWGYGVYDTDSALDTVSNILDLINVKENDNLILEDNTIIDREWSGINDGRLHPVIIQLLIDNAKKIESKVLKNEYLDDQGENYLVFADIITSHNREFPQKLLKKAIKSISSLNEEDGSSDQYDSPTARKAVVNKVLNILQAQVLELELPKKEVKKGNKIKL